MNSYMNNQTTSRAPSQPLAPNQSTFRSQPTTMEETGIGFGQILDLCLKAIHHGGRPSARDICERIALPFTGVVENALTFLKREKHVELAGAGGISEQQYQYMLTETGARRAADAIERNAYFGPAPVPYDQYVKVVREQSMRNQRVDGPIVDEALSDLVLGPMTRNLVGPAVNSGRSILLYGEPGNGKSSIAKGIRRMLRGDVLIPHAVDVNGHTIRVFDSRVHQPSPRALLEDHQAERNAVSQDRRRDMRWVVAQRPLIVTGGELTLSDLELKYTPQSRFYIAPIQMKANCGVLV